MKKVLLVFIILFYFQNQQAQSVDPLASKDLESQNKWVDSIYNKLSIDDRLHNCPVGLWGFVIHRTLAFGSIGNGWGFLLLQDKGNGLYI